MNKFASALMTVLGAVAVHAQDGTYFSTLYSNPYKYSLGTHWNGGVVAQNGGVATIHPNTSWDKFNIFVQDVAGLELSGINFVNALFTMTGNPIKFVADNSVVDYSRFDPDNNIKNLAKELTVAVAFKGTGENCLVKKGKGWMNFAVPVEDFAVLYFKDGVILSTNASGRIVAKTPINFSKRIDVCPGPAEELASELTLGNGQLTASGDAAQIRLAKGANTSLVLKASSLALPGCSTLAIGLDDGIGSLGESVKFKLDETSGLADGIVDQRIVARDRSVASAPFSLLSYDADKGFVPAPVTDGFDGGADKIARISESCNLAKSKEVLALVVDNSASITNASDVTIKVGDGVNPASVLLNNQVGSKNYNEIRGGAIDFGSSHGIFYRSANDSGQATRFICDIKGDNGVSFVAKSDTSIAPYVVPYKNAQWTGPTYISGLRFWLDSGCDVPKPFPDGGDVYVTGGKSWYSGQLYIFENYNDQKSEQHIFMPSFSQHFYLSGYGCQATDQNGALFFVRSHSIFNGRVTLLGDTLINILENGLLNIKNSKIEFNKPIDGEGELKVTITQKGDYDYFGSAIVLNATNTFVGKLVVEPGVDVVMNTNGTFAVGDVVLNDAGLKFAENGLFSVTNNIIGSGKLNLGKFATLNLDGETEFASASGEYGSTLTLGGNMYAGNVDFGPGSTISAAKNDLTLYVDGGVINNALTESSQAKLNIVKSKEGELELGGDCGGISSLKIEKGTVKLSKSVFEDAAAIEYWLDAADPSTITLDENGGVAKWASKAGRDLSFSVVSNRKAPKYKTGAINDLNAILFTNGVYQVSETQWAAKDSTQLAADGEATQRTLFIVSKPLDFSPGSKFGAIFGNTNAGNSGYGGIRMDYTWCWTVCKSGDSKSYYPMLDKVFMDGVLKKSEANNDKVMFKINELQVAAFFHPYDGLSSGTFVPVVGGCRHDIFYSGDGITNLFPVDFNGYIAEVIAFNRMLSDDEVLEVSDYLGKKWHGEKYVAKSVSTTSLSADAAVELFGEGKFDLNGVSQSISSLFGSGEVVNSSEKPAVLTVAETCNFNGKVSGNVVVKVADGSLALEPSHGVDVVVGKGDVVLEAYNYSVPVDGLCYWLDASHYASFTLDESGMVTNWASMVEGTKVSKFYWAAEKVTNNKSGSGWIFDPPEYVADGLNGKPAIKSKNANHATVNGVYETGSALVADTQTTTKTFFMVGNVISHPYYSSGIFGNYAKDEGYRFNNPESNNMLSIMANDCSFLRGGDIFRLNGENGLYPADNMASYSRHLTLGEPFVMSFVKYSTVHATGYNSFPGYFVNRSPEMYVSEVIAYDRVLSDEEIREIERYLTAKWIENDGEIPPRNDTVLADGSTITIVAENGEVGKLTVEGDLNLGAVDFRLVDMKTLSSADARDVVEVKGTLSGTLGEVERENSGSWKLEINGGAVRLFKPGFFLLMR